MCVLGASLLTGCTQQTAQTGANVDKAELSPNGIALPQGYKDWRLIATSHRTDNDSLRAILGNDIAVDAARLGQTNPWPDGAILAKLVWKDTVHEDDWPEATVPGKFLHAEFMVKDEKLYPQTGGWGFARWLGEDQKPYGEDDSFARYECFACHTPMKKNDYVFSRPAVMP
ncbi:MAG: cytochrome P460 [Robiginitomaculum sp.]|nr:MAG: cytochrome P460 [Robiginitomaculum sp.]